MKTFFLTKTAYLVEYIETKAKFIDYEITDDSVILKLISDEKLFWVGYGYHKYLDENH